MLILMKVIALRLNISILIHDDVIIIRSESTTYFYDQNIPTHFESHIHRTSRYRKDQEKAIMMEIEKLAKGTNRATEKFS